MPRSRPLEGAPGWRVVESPRRRSWRAGYVIVPLAVCAGFFLALAPLHPDWPAWPDGEVLEASSARALKAREAEILDAAKAEVLAIVRSREDVPRHTPDAERVAPTLPGRGIAYDLPVEDAPLPKLRPSGSESASSPGETTNPAEPPAASPMRVFIHHTAGAADAATASRLATFLQERGFTVAALRSVDRRIDLPSVRYFFGPDQAGSRRLIDAIQGFFAKAPEQAPDQATDRTRFSPKPRRGSVEVWLPGHAAGWTRAAQADPPS